MLLIAEFWQVISHLVLCQNSFHVWRTLFFGWPRSLLHGTWRAYLVKLAFFLLNLHIFFCRLVGGLLTLSLDYCFVLEDEDGICGYALGTVDVTPFIKKCKMSWIPFMQEKYTKPNSDKELSEAEVGITCEIRTVCWSLSKVGLCFSLSFWAHMKFSFCAFLKTSSMY